MPTISNFHDPNSRFPDKLRGLKEDEEDEVLSEEEQQDIWTRELTFHRRLYDAESYTRDPEAQQPS